MTLRPKVSFDFFFQQTVAAAFERQLRLGDVVSDRAWNFSMTDGTLSFAKKGFFGKILPLPVQILGTESEGSGTWLWSWANAASGIPENLLLTAHRLQDLGNQHGIPELVKGQLPLDELDGHRVGTVASGLNGRGAYYRCPYDGGAMFVYLPDVVLPKVDYPAVRVTTVFPQVLDAYEVTDHRAALRGLLQALEFRLEEDSATSVVATHGKTSVQARFDDRGRMVTMESSS